MKNSNDTIWDRNSKIPIRMLQYKRTACLVHSQIGKTVLLQVWNGPEGSRKLRFPDFMMSQGGGKVVSLTHWPHLPPGNSPGTHFC